MSRGTNAVLVLVGGLGVTVLALAILAAAGTATLPPPSTPVGATLRPGAVPAPYQQAVTAAGQVCAEAPAPVIAAQIQAESSWNPAALSPAGAQGLAQVLPGTWALYGIDADHDGRADPLDPLDAIASQAAYDCALATQLRPAVTAGAVTGASLTELMLAAYNAGPGPVLTYGLIPPYDETRTYVAKIMALAASYATAPPETAALGARIVAAATTQLGVPYAWGGGTATGPSHGISQGSATIGWDCSGLVLYAVAQASGGQIQMPRVADAQTRVGTPVPLGDLQPGDLISFTLAGESTAHHIGIYTGANRMIHAPETGSVVSIVNLDDPYWKAQQWRAVRIG